MARMSVQDALIKAIEAFPRAGPMANPEGWLFRIAHNAALDFLRRRARRERADLDEDPDMIVDPPIRSPPADRAPQSAHLHAPAAGAAQQRRPDGRARLFARGDRRHHDTSIPAVKAALHRGRARLRELAEEPEDGRFPR